ncbi:putative HicB family RNase H-like nuclease [Methylobacterium persicinum]|uniref:HicB family RNase H-like nuclease n=1 Tax=Methylobacterium persicinum TaxID=374426 RepID=A0ABU0HT26_9HYPH|nr:putative HicB family RNase H-like nuclease [Methylobacterium persicinum]
MKTRIEGLAAANKQSLNAWIMRCLETCANAQSQSR